MSVRTVVKLDSKIFDRSALKLALGAVAVEQAKNFVKDVQDEMENSPHTGTVVTKVRGESFRIRHQQSRRGERPSPFSRDLINSIKEKKTGDLSATVFSDSKYANKLIFDDGRVIVSDEDLAEAKVKQTEACNAAMRALL